MKLSFVQGIMITLPFLLSMMICYCNAAAADPTFGFTEIPLNQSNLVLQKPFDIPLDQRYSFVNGTHRMWVYADDKPHDPGSHTQPRTEIRVTAPNAYNSIASKFDALQGLDYKSGVWHFEGHGFVPNGTSGATVAQIHGGAHDASSLILRVYAPGEMSVYSSPHFATGLYDRWFRLNIIHNVDAGMLTVFLDGEQKFQHPDKGPGDLYFKCSVYAAQFNISYYMESRWRDIRIYRK